MILCPPVRLCGGVAVGVYKSNKGRREETYSSWDRCQSLGRASGERTADMREPQEECYSLFGLCLVWIV